MPRSFEDKIDDIRKETTSNKIKLGEITILLKNHLLHHEQREKFNRYILGVGISLANLLLGYLIFLK